MSFIKCPDCGKEINLFGKSKLEEISKEIGVDILGRIPIDPKIAQLVDAGEFERFDCDCLASAAKQIENIFSKEI